MSVSRYIAVVLRLWRIQEPNLSQSRLGLLIDSLAAGADLYIDGKSPEEVRMVLGE